MQGLRFLCSFECENMRGTEHRRLLLKETNSAKSFIPSCGRNATGGWRGEQQAIAGGPGQAIQARGHALHLKNIEYWGEL